MIVTLVAALAEGRLVGSASGGIPWDLPRDRVHFRATTKGGWLLLGRKTYGEMEGWFTDQIPLVLSRGERGSFRLFDDSHRVVPSVEDAIGIAERNGARDLLVCGGAGVYEAAMPLADRLVLTRIGAEFEVENPVFFPEFEESGEWETVGVETWPPSPECPFPARLEKWRRVR